MKGDNATNLREVARAVFVLGEGHAYSGAGAEKSGVAQPREITIKYHLCTQEAIGRTLEGNHEKDNTGKGLCLLLDSRAHQDSVSARLTDTLEVHS